MLNAARRIPAEEYFVFYGNTDSPDQGLHHTGDDPTGGNSAEGDDEVIEVDLSKVGADVQEILFVVTIHEASLRKQNFGQVRASYIRIVDQSTNSEIAKYELGEDFSIETGVEFGRLYRRDNKWRFEASGIGVGLGWNPNEGTGGAFDLDASAFMLNEGRKLVSDGHFIFYNNTDSPDQAVHYSGDDTTGGNSDGDDETILIDLEKVGAEALSLVVYIAATVNGNLRHRELASGKS
nr:hypothetical protein [Tanacetum cinerariifolium]